MSRPTAAEAPALPVVAHMVEKGRLFVDQPVLEADEAERAAFKRQDGAIVSPLVRLYDAQAALDKLTAERDEAREQVRAWLAENGRGGWIDDLRNAEQARRIELEALKARDAARAESLRDSLRLDWLERHAVGIENSAGWWSVFGDDTGSAKTLRGAIDDAAGLAEKEQTR